jgi:hypothetical protein
MNKIVFIFYIFLLKFHLFSQNNYKKYHETLNKIYSHDSICNDSIIYFYERAFEYANPFSEDVYDLAYYYYVDDDIVKSEQSLEKSILLGFQMKKDYKDNDSLYPEINYGHYSFNNELNDSLDGYYNFELNFIKNRYDSLRNIFLHSVKNDYYFEVLLNNELYSQLIRLNRDHSFFTRQILNDEVFKPNARLMYELLLKDKLPLRRMSKRFNSYSITMLLNHCIAGMESRRKAEVFMDMLWGKVVLGELTPIEYASAYDHFVHHFVHSRKSYFGTNLKNGRVRKLLYPNKINELRKDCWLITIEDYTRYYGLRLPKNVKL